MIMVENRSMLAEIMPGLVVPFLIASAVMAFGHFYQPLQYLTTSMKRWLLWCSTLGLIIPLVILLIYPPNTDTALNAACSRLLWPSVDMLMAADPYTPPSGVALVIGISVAANVLAYLAIGLLVWTVASWTRRLRHDASK
jgi:hypothetical protein